MRTIQDTQAGQSEIFKVIASSVQIEWKALRREGFLFDRKLKASRLTEPDYRRSTETLAE